MGWLGNNHAALTGAGNGVVDGGGAHVQADDGTTGRGGGLVSGLVLISGMDTPLTLIVHSGTFLAPPHPQQPKDEDIQHDQRLP